jgi:hypothetical protein
MSYPNNMYSIAMNLLLPPVNMKVPHVAEVMGIPYSTLTKWKRDALSAQGAKKRQGKSTKPIVRLKVAQRIKRDPSGSGSQPTRTRNRSVQNVRSTPIGTDAHGILKLLAEDY